MEMLYMASFCKESISKLLIVPHIFCGNDEYEIGVSCYVITLHDLRRGFDGERKFLHDL
jgi:hypothetical protein